jgi:SRSO17 transposase
MDLVFVSGGSEARFNTYLDALSAELGHADRAVPFQSYCTGLLLPGDRKSVEPMAARLEPERVQATHQSLHHLVAKADWSDEAMLTAVRSQVLPVIEQHGAINAWIVDDTGFPKKGTQSIGVARQYCGQLGKQDNCQVAVSLSVANDDASLPIAYQLYLPQAWTGDPARRGKAGVPEDIVFQTKPQIALGQIRTALLAGVASAVVLADAGYGVDTEFRDGITELGLRYVVGIQSSTTLWPPGQEPLPAKPWSGRGRRPARLRHDDDHQPVSAKNFALGLPSKAWRRITWREGSNTKLASRFAAVRVRPAQGDTSRSAPRAEEWGLIEWPKSEAEPTKYWFSTLPANTCLTDLVRHAKRRWRIERDYQDLKQELGLGQYEGRGWRGFHHHATLCIAAYGFLIMERAAFPPSTDRRASFVTIPPLPEGYRPRRSPAAAGTPCGEIDHHHPHHHCQGSCTQAGALPLLPMPTQSSIGYDTVRLAGFSAKAYSSDNVMENKQLKLFID